MDVCHTMGSEMCTYKFEQSEGEKVPVKPVQKASVIKAPAKSFHAFQFQDEDVFADTIESTVTQKEVQQFFVRQASLEPEDELPDDHELPDLSFSNESDMPDFVRMTNLTFDTNFSQVKFILEESPATRDHYCQNRIDFALRENMDPKLEDISDDPGLLSDFLIESRDAPLVASVNFMMELKELERVAFKRLGEYKLLSPMTFAYFFRRFKADDAKYNIDNFHLHSMNFKPQKTTRWLPQEEGWIQREIEMMCKVEDVPNFMKKDDLMHVHSTVKLKKIGQGIFVMHKRTKTFGVPLCDTFVLHHVWEITQRRGLHFESYFGIEWTKTSWGIWNLGKKGIEKRNVQDSDEYDKAYFEMLVDKATTTSTRISDSKRSPELSSIHPPVKESKTTRQPGTPPPKSSPYFWEKGKVTPFIANIQYDGAMLPAAVFPNENGKVNVTIMQSDLAMDRDVVGLHLFDFPKIRVLLTEEK